MDQNNKIIYQVQGVLKSRRFNLTNEKKLQAEVFETLASSCNNLTIEREKKLSNWDIIDIWIEGSIGIEIKIKGSGRNIYHQLERYCHHPELKTIILLTNKAIGLPQVINGKPAYYINLALAWL